MYLSFRIFRQFQRAAPVRSFHFFQKHIAVIDRLRTEYGVNTACTVHVTVDIARAVKIDGIFHIEIGCVHVVEIEGEFLVRFFRRAARRRFVEKFFVAERADAKTVNRRIFVNRYFRAFDKLLHVHHDLVPALMHEIIFTNHRRAVVDQRGNLRALHGRIHSKPDILFIRRHAHALRHASRAVDF